MANKTVRVTGTQGASQRMDIKARQHTIVVDQPPSAGGQDSGMTPLELLAGALAGCMGAIGRIVAHQRKIALRGMEVEIEGAIDPDGLLGRPTENRVGFQGFTVRVNVDADLSLEEKRAFVEEIERRCPVSENLAQTTPIQLEVR